MDKPTLFPPEQPTLFPLDQSASVYEALRDVRWIVEGVEIPEWLTSCGVALEEDEHLAEESYARVLLVIRLVRLLRQRVDRLNWISEPAGAVAGDVLHQLFELESLLAGQVMAYKAEALKMDADRAELALP